VITLIQRVHRARVLVDGSTVGEIERGLLLFVGVERGDTAADADITVRKVANLRAFPGRSPMDLGVKDVGGSCLVVSQFTLAADLRRGNRPDFGAAADPVTAKALYERVTEGLRGEGIAVATGRFQSTMNVESANDGPVNLLLVVRDGRPLGRE
jgi:D-tyrosyl-tRNA(Tyr) deacylase